MTIRIEDQQCLVTVENAFLGEIAERIEGEDVESQIEILIKQLILGSWKKFIEDVENNSLVDAIQKHGFDDYSNGPDAVVNY